jgi:undecaprenyl-diphosphatase
MRRSLREPFYRLRHFLRREFVLLAAILVAAVSTLVFIKLADEVIEGETQTFDERVLRSLRRADDPAVPLGPAWLREAALDVPALGSTVVLTLVLSGVTGFLLIQRKIAMMWLTLFTTLGGTGLAVLLKDVIDRGRPTVVPHLREVTSPSFPSGHAMLSAIVYLTLGSLLTQVVPGRLSKLYVLLWALVLTFLVRRTSWPAGSPAWCGRSCAGCLSATCAIAAFWRRAGILRPLTLRARRIEFHLRDEFIGASLKTLGVTPGNGFPVASNVRLAEEVDQVLFPFVPILRLQQFQPDVMLEDFLEKRETEFAHAVQLRSLSLGFQLTVRRIEQVVFLGMLENKPIE